MNEEQKKYFLGIDPGATGAWVLLDQYHSVYRAEPFINRFQLLTLVREHKLNVAFGCIEKAHAMPGQGVSSMFNYGTSFGIWLGWLETLQIPYELVTPQEWQTKILDIGVPSCKATSKAQRRLQIKTHIVNYVKRRFPGLEATLAVKKNWGIADAACIAAYAITAERRCS